MGRNKVVVVAEQDMKDTLDSLFVRTHDLIKDSEGQYSGETIYLWIPKDKERNKDHILSIGTYGSCNGCDAGFMIEEASETLVRMTHDQIVRFKDAARKRIVINEFRNHRTTRERPDTAYFYTMNDVEFVKDKDGHYNGRMTADRMYRRYIASLPAYCAPSLLELEEIVVADLPDKFALFNETLYAPYKIDRCRVDEMYARVRRLFAELTPAQGTRGY